MNPYLEWLSFFHCSSFQQLYSKVETIARQKMGITKMPFPLSAIENPPETPGSFLFLDLISLHFVLTISFHIIKGLKGTKSTVYFVIIKENPQEIDYET